MTIEVCLHHGTALTRAYSLSTGKPTGDPYCPYCRRDAALTAKPHRCPFVRAVAAGDLDQARTIALAGDDPAELPAIPVLLSWAVQLAAGVPLDELDYTAGAGLTDDATLALVRAIAPREPPA